MTKHKVLQISLLLFCIFLLSIVFTAFDMPFDDTNSTPFELSNAIGLTFKNMLKIVVTLAIARMVYVKIKIVGESSYS